VSLNAGLPARHDAHLGDELAVVTYFRRGELRGVARDEIAQPAQPGAAQAFGASASP